MVRVEDLPISDKRVFLHVSKRKSLCLEDGRIRVEALDWIRGGVTKRFAEYVYRLTSITTNKEAGWFLGLDDEKVYRIDREIIEELANETLEKIEPPRHISVEEVAWRKWHKYVTNVVDIEKRKVIWNHNGRGKSILDRFYREIGKQGCRKIDAVVSDGARGFTASTRQHLNDAIDAVRKEELRKARKDNNTIKT